MSRSGSDLNGHEGLPTPYPECVLEGKHFSGELLKQAQSLSNAKRMCAEVDPFPVGSIQEAYDIQAAISQNAIIFQRGMMSRYSSPNPFGFRDPLWVSRGTVFHFECLGSRLSPN
jgi:hypothetical protein